MKHDIAANPTSDGDSLIVGYSHGVSPRGKRLTLDFFDFNNLIELKMTLMTLKIMKVIYIKTNIPYVGYLRHGFDFFLNGFAYMCVPTLVSLVPSRT